MSAYDQVFSNPSLDADRPASGPILVNASPSDLAVLLAVELTRAPDRAEAVAMIKGLDSTEKEQTHTVRVSAPTNVVRTTIAVRVAAMKDAKPRTIDLEVVSPGALCTVRVLSAIPN